MQACTVLSYTYGVDAARVQERIGRPEDELLRVPEPRVLMPGSRGMEINLGQLTLAADFTGMSQTA